MTKKHPPTICLHFALGILVHACETREGSVRTLVRFQLLVNLLHSMHNGHLCWISGSALLCVEAAYVNLFNVSVTPLLKTIACFIDTEKQLVYL